MNKNAIKKFAIEARKKLIASVTDKAGMLGITEQACSEPIMKGSDFEVYQTAAGTEATLNRTQCEQRRRLVSQIESRGFEAVVEEVAYTWFNRICAIRFMEVNDYLPNRVRVLSSEKEGKLEPDLVTQAPDVDLDLTAQDKEEIINWKLSGTSEDTDKLYCKLFLKQCHQLHDILPGLFEADSDYMELLFGISYTNKDDVIYMLVNLETGIPEADFNVSTLDEEGNPTGQVEIIGWLYQYYNTELKDDTFAKLKKNVKITKERIPAATQLFTPDWIVWYMVENSVGRIWIEHLRAVDPSTDEKATAESFGWKYYLPEAEQEESVNVKLAEIRTTYKDLKPTDITCIDPCMGSGHILIAMFDVLMDIYESAGYDKREAAFEIVEHNIHGMDIDQRAYQLAYFAVMMKGRGYNRRFLRGRDGKLEPKVYAIVESNEINRNHLQFFGTHLSEMERNLALMQMEGLLDTFIDAREYGSILNVNACDWDVLEKFVDDLDATGQITFESVGSEETQESLRKLVKVAKNLGQKYDAVVTNPPYRALADCSNKLNDYVKKNYPDSKSDLFAVFIELCSKMTKKVGYQAMITQHAWMFLSGFIKLRAKLQSTDIINMAHLGPRAFEEISGEVVQTTSFVLRKSNIIKYLGIYVRLVKANSQDEKEKMFLSEINRFHTSKITFTRIPEEPIVYWLPEKALLPYNNAEVLLGDVAAPCAGLATGDNNTFQRYWYEVFFENIGFGVQDVSETKCRTEKWYPCNSSGDFRKWYTDNLMVVNWQYNGKEIKNFRNAAGKLAARPQNTIRYFKEGLTWNKLSTSRFAVKYKAPGFVFDDTSRSAFPHDLDLLPYYIGSLCSCVTFSYLQALDPTMSFTNGDLVRIPMVVDENKKDTVTKLVKECIEYSKTDWDSFEISWDFKEHPLIRTKPFTYKEMEEDLRHNIHDMNQMSEAYRRWQNECYLRFTELKKNEEELNGIFINIYGLQDELTPEVEDKDVTVCKADLGRDVRSFISYAVGCMFGRYSLDKEGLIYAGGDWNDTFQYYGGTFGDIESANVKWDGSYTWKELGTPFYYLPMEGKNPLDCWKVDADNVIPITDEEYFSDDIVGRFVEFVRTVYGADTLEENLTFIANALGNKGDTSREVIRNYFLKDFYADHLKVYQKRPIYWFFDSGKQNGFKALIYMHRYDADTVGRVRTDYLHRAQKYVETAMQSAQYTIENATSSSEKSKATKAVIKYTKQLAEMKLYDEAIAHIANKRIEIDLDDGVKVNYAKFQGVEVAQEGKKALKIDLLATIK